MIDIEGLDKGAVLAALVNNGSPIGMGSMHYRKVTPEEARPLLYGYIDYAFGVPIKATLGTDEFDEWGYDRDQGDGAAARAIDSIR